MDFNLDEDLVDLAGLVREILADHAESADPERLWGALAGAGVTGLTVPETYGGAGLGIAAVAVVLEEQGPQVAALPLAASLLATGALAAAGDVEPAARLLPGLATGEHRLTLALEEPAPARLTSPRTVATRADGGWRISGTKAGVPAVEGAAGVVLTATTPEGVGVFLVEPARTTGIEDVPALQSDRSVASRLVLTDAAATCLGTGSAVDRLWQRARVAVAALQLGVAAGAVSIAARYVSDRVQFGRPLGTFQSVQHRLADASMAIDALRVSLAQAVDDLHRDRPEAERSVLVAQWWTARAGMDVVLGAQHVHGGMGVDVSYPIHRYFLWGRQLATMYGGASGASAELGDLLVQERTA